MQPTVIDSDNGAITVSVNGHRVRDWIYTNEADRRRMMSEARWYVEGWCDGREEADSGGVFGPLTNHSVAAEF